VSVLSSNREYSSHFPARLSTYYAVYYTASNFGNFAGETALPALRVYSSFYVIFSIVAAVGLATVCALPQTLAQRRSLTRGRAGWRSCSAAHTAASKHRCQVKFHACCP
jgi:hypothetical protein